MSRVSNLLGRDDVHGAPLAGRRPHQDPDGGELVAHHQVVEGLELAQLLQVTAQAEAEQQAGMLNLNKESFENVPLGTVSRTMICHN